MALKMTSYGKMMKIKTVIVKKMVVVVVMMKKSTVGMRTLNNCSERML
jgi:hypothetical protein